MLEYEKQIFLDILESDGLVVAAKGLGLESVVVELLKVQCDPGNLVFVLGTEGKHQDWLVSTLTDSGASPVHVISSEMSVAAREESYLEGGIWFVPTRILVVDLLKKRVPIDLITGFVVWKAHGILQRHQDSFILRLYRQGNKTGFIKAFSNHAPGFVGGISKVERILKALFVRKLFLWPRYHASVKECLSSCMPKVIELQLEMTGNMLQLQTALLDMIKSSIQEIRRLNPTLDTDEVSVDNAICDSFHKLLHSQLDPIWHMLSERTKLLLADLKLFHYLIRSLLIHDSVSFYSLVKQQRTADGVRQGSGWQTVPAAEILFTISQRRVFPQPGGPPDPESSPKWLALTQVLSEIHRSLPSASRGKTETATDSNKETATILVLTRDERSCSQLNTYLKLGAKELLEIQFRKFSAKGNITTKDSENSSKNSQETQEEEEEELGNQFILSLTQSAIQQLETEETTNLAGLFEDSFLTTQVLNDSLGATQPSAEVPVIFLKAWQQDILQLPKFLEEIQPRWVIMYDVDMTIVRQLEVYQRYHCALELAVYFIIYGGTVEEQAYLTSLAKENEAFNVLIEEKGRLVIPEDRSDCPELMRDARKANEALTGIIDTRKGGVKENESSATRLVIVDMREFRSELPALIHSRGIDIEPLTITVGDYILTPNICVERKSVSDLIQSLNSGRLYNQAQAMTRNYSMPLLLIEFDKDKPFDLQDRYYFSNDTVSDQFMAKLQLLTLHFPQLLPVWSESPQASSVLFDELKEGQPEPDPVTAIGIGTEETPSDLVYNTIAQNFLLKLPGVTSKNFPILMRKGGSLDKLRKMTVEELNGILGNVSEAEALYQAIHSKLEPAEGDSAGSKVFRPMANKKRKRFH